MQLSRHPEGATRDGNQTFARGLRVLLAIADADHGMTVRQVEEMLGVHRSIAYRLLQTLNDFGLVSRGQQGVYLPGARMATLADSYLPSLREVAIPYMRRLADQLESTVALFVEQGSDALAVAMMEPTTSRHHIAFQSGMWTPMDRGAAAYAILAGSDPVDGEQEAVQIAREAGFARSRGEVETGEFGIAAWIPLPPHMPRACLNVITHRVDIADSVGPAVRKAANELAHALAEEN
ncbi:IclR family transcriptional regulator [Rhodococcus sp. NPDC127530]|uniref:IclR family transcriptional regulator n=1 Tax=unclassified Rhodococcus (in: high G+C Gram-positive bacteria) TaxID=192944 RepID=UPI003640DF27